MVPTGSALGAIGIGVLITVAICVAAAARYENVLYHEGPNLASNQLIVYTQLALWALGPGGGGPGSAVTPSKQSMAASERGIAAAPGSHDMVQLDSASADLRHAGPGGTALDPSMSPLRSSWGPLGSSRRAVSPTADILSMRPGLAAMGGVLPVRGDARAATIAPDSD